MYAQQMYPETYQGFSGNDFEESDILELDGCGTVDDGRPLQDWQTHIAPAFGCYARQMGTEEGNWLVEVDDDDDLGDGTVRTPILEFGIDDFNYLRRMGRPIPGMQAFGDNGDLYEYSIEPIDGGFGGLRSWFKKKAKKARKVLRKIVKSPISIHKRIKKGTKKILSKTRFGRALIKVGGKIHSTMMKKVKPWIKKYGPIMQRFAPVAMAIPGIGPIVSKAMTMTGHVAKAIKFADGAMKVHKFVDKHNGNIGSMVKATVRNPQAFVSALQQGANMVQQMMPAQRGNLAKKFDMLAKLKSGRGRLNQLLPVQGASRASEAVAQKLSILAQKDNALAFARSRSKPLMQRRRAMSHARQLQGRNMMSIANTRIAEFQGRQPNKQQFNQIRAMKIASLKMQLRALGVSA